MQDIKTPPFVWTMELEQQLIKLWARFKISYIVQELNIPKSVIGRKISSLKEKGIIR